MNSLDIALRILRIGWASADHSSLENCTARFRAKGLHLIFICISRIFAILAIDWCGCALNVTLWDSDLDRVSCFITARIEELHTRSSKNHKNSFLRKANIDIARSCFGVFSTRGCQQTDRCDKRSERDLLHSKCLFKLVAQLPLR